MAKTVWRVFPWDPGAKEGDPFSPQYLPAQSGQGRFDLPHTIAASSWYFAESPDHAVAEKLQDLRNARLVDDFLFERGHRLACSAVRIDGVIQLADLCDPIELARRSIAPDQLAFRNRVETQSIARDLHGDPDISGFRWWSALFGEWHTVVLFSDRLAEGMLTFLEPEELQLTSRPLLDAASALGIEIGG